MNKLSSLPNIGKIIEGKLNQVGINTPETFRALGAKEAFLRIRVIDNSACSHMLYALEGAVQNIPYTKLSKEKIEELRTFYNQIKG